MQREILLEVNGKKQELILEKGYALIDKKWESGDEITLYLPMEIRRVISDEKVEENRDMVALERGPILFCVEGLDNNGLTHNIVLPDELQLSERYIGDLLGGISVIEGDNFNELYPILPGLTGGQVRWMSGFPEALQPSGTEAIK